jgi:Nis1 family
MRFTSAPAVGLASALSLFSGASAIITGVTAPSTVYAYNPFTVSLTTADYIQSVYDVAVAFGVAPGAGYPNSLGNVMSTAYLGPSQSNILTPIEFSVTLPAGTQNGPYILTASVMSLLGVAYEPSLEEFNATITVAGF